MAIEPMKEVFVFCLDEKLPDLLKHLQLEGNFHVDDFWEEYGVEKFYGLEKAEPPEILIDVAEVLTQISRIRDSLRDIHARVNPASPIDALKSYFSAEEPTKVEFDLVSLEKNLEKAKKFLEKLREDVQTRLKELDEINERISALRETRRILKEIIKYGAEFDVSHLGEGEYVDIKLFHVRSEAWDSLLEFAEDEPVYVEQVGWYEEGEPLAVIAYPKGMEPEIRRHGAAELDVVNSVLEGREGDVKDVVEEISREIDDLIGKRRELMKELSEYYEENAPEIEAHIELLENERRLFETLEKMAMTERTYLVYGWVPEAEEDKFIEIVQKATNGYCEVIVRDPEDIERMPVRLRNPRPFRPFETLVEMFSLPKPTEIDPTPVMTIFFPIYFGFILTDAAYGAILTAAALAIRLTRGRVDEKMKMFSEILIYSGIATVILGVLTGGYFGNLFGIKPLWIDPMKDPITILLVALGFGVLQVGLGLIFGMRIALKEGDKKAFLGEGLSWFLVLVGGLAAVIGVTQGGITSPITLAGAGILGLGVLLAVAMTGPLAALDTVGFMGDILSYSRLLAGCLSTSGIAMVVNLLAKMAKQIGVIGYLFAAVILVLGHIFNMAMNGLGAFVHSLRLHYVEFFGQFYEGGGKKFDPLKVEGKHLVIKA